MKRPRTSTRFAVVVLAALLALPAAHTAAPVGAKGRPRTVTKTFANPESIVIVVADVDPPMTGYPYPSEVAVGGVKQGKIRDVNVRLNGLTHFYPDDVQVALVGPGGQSATLMAKAGGSGDAVGVNLRLDDEAAAPLPDQDDLASGTFKPTNATGNQVDFEDLDPDPSAAADLSVFDGTNPNGTWRLYVQDEYAPTDPGALAGGWALEITAKAKAKKKRR